MNTGTFRRSIKTETKNTGRKGGGGFFDRWRLPKDNPTPLMMIRAEYIDPAPPQDAIEIDPQTGKQCIVKNAYKKVTKHKRKLMKNGSEFFPDEICSAGHDPHNPQPCVGCTAIDLGDKSVTTSDVFVFGVVHLHPYHGHPVIGDNGQIRTRQDGSPMINFAECTGRTCNFCRTLQGQPLVQDPKWPNWRADQISTKFGHRRYLELGKGHLADLGSWDASVGTVCGNDGAQLETDGFCCPWCNTKIIDMMTDTRSDADIAEAVSKPYPCMTCRRSVLLREVMHCAACANAGREPKVMSIFTPEIVLWGLREGEGTKSKLTLRKFDHIQNFSQTVPAHLLGGKTVSQIIEELSKPYDFDDMFKPRSLSDQAKRLELPMPGQGMASGYGQANGQPYMGQPGGVPQNTQQGGNYVPYGAPVTPQQTQHQPQQGMQYAAQPAPQQTFQPPPVNVGPSAFVPPVPPNYGNNGNG